MSSQRPPMAPSEASFTSSISSSREWSPDRRRTNTIHLTPHTDYPTTKKSSNHPYPNSTGLEDPRSSSTQSLRPVESAGSGRRTLLIIYIHGFMGTETSFQSFPAHVHSLLTVTLAETHVIHTKIYPRYESRHDISVARDNFSNWLYPHESDSTDVILIGHSLGGILAAEVAILPSHVPGSNDLYQHRLLGIIAFDTPYLGMHPGVVSTGIASLFRGTPEEPVSPSDTSNPVSLGASTISSIASFFNDGEPADPNYNPAFPNDVKRPVRKNKFERAWYFWNKHSGDLRNAAQSYVKSHLEFGGCMADYPGLRRRYEAVRALEDIDEFAGKKASNGRLLRRVRFVNYYTASTGRIKEFQPPSSNATLVAETEMVDVKSESSGARIKSRSQSRTPRISLEEYADEKVVAKELDDLDLEDYEALTEMNHLDPRPTSDEEEYTVSHAELNIQDTTVITPTTTHDDLPPIPAMPTAPPEFNASKYSDSDVLQVAKKDHERVVKAYERAKKDRERAIKDREKVIVKREKAATKAKIKEQEKAANLAKAEEAKAAKLAKAEEDKLVRAKSKQQSTLNPEAYEKQVRKNNEEQAKAIAAAGGAPKPPKKQRDRKFCSLPDKDPTTGARDSTWIRVFMEGMDEVVAHTSLFKISETYAKLVGDTAARIEDWVREDATARKITEEMYAVD